MSEEEQFAVLLQYIFEAFAEEQDGSLELDLQAVGHGSPTFREQLCSAGVGVSELYQAHLKAFADEVLTVKNSPHYLLKSGAHAVNRYLKFYDVIPNGPDVIKHVLGFGFTLDTYLRGCSTGEQLQVSALARMRTLRILRNCSAGERDDGAALSAAMMRKLQRAWCQGIDVGYRHFGIYGTYMIFKTWSLPGVMYQDPQVAAAA